MLLVAELTVLLLWVRLIIFCVLGLWSRRRPAHAPMAISPSPRIALVIPAFNEAAHIGETLQALLRSDPIPWEIIVVDDGSADGTAGIAQHCLADHPRASVLRLASNAGKAAALNAGIAHLQCDLVATVDADTRLEPNALARALACLRQTGADAVAFHIDVDNRGALLGQLQRQEYVAALNYERAAQGVIQAIAILPGAATLFRRDVLTRYPFSGRTRTEDADLTLQVAGSGVKTAVADDATAMTVVPDTWAGLFAQRIRWAAGHLQCCRRHAMRRDTVTWIFRLLILPNFIVSTISALCGGVALATILMNEHTQYLNIAWADATGISLGLVYLQRCSALVGIHGRPRFLCFALEPLVSGVVGSVSVCTALVMLTNQDRHVQAEALSDGLQKTEVGRRQDKGKPLS